MKQSRSLEANSSWPSQEISRNWWNPKIHDRDTSLIPLLMQIKPVNAVPFCCFRIHFKFTLPIWLQIQDLLLTECIDGLLQFVTVLIVTSTPTNSVVKPVYKGVVCSVYNLCYYNIFVI
jgi:hypothetical protein